MRRSVVAFLCSTYADLQDERSAVLDALTRLRVQHDAMEFFGARHEAPLAVCLEEVRKSNVVIVIVGNRYGSLVPDSDVSYAEAEYREAFALDKPCLVYLRDDSVPVLPANIEREPANMPRLEAFKRILETRHTVARFRASHDLAVQVAADLGRVLDSLERSAEVEEASPTDGTRLLDRAFEVLRTALAEGVSADDLLAATQRAMANLRGASGQRKLQVFLSHSHADKELVTGFASALRELGVDPWLDDERIAVGDSIVEAVGYGLNSSDCVVAFVSEAYLASGWSRRELDVAIAGRLGQSTTAKIVPVLLGNVELPPLLRDVRYIDMRDGNAEKAARELLNSLLGGRQMLAGPGSDERINIKDLLFSPGSALPVRRKF